MSRPEPPAKSMLRYAILSVALFVFVFPMLWMFRIALLPVGEPVAIDSISNSSFTLRNFIDLFATLDLLRPFLNSALVAIVVTGGNLLFCFMTAYALARKQTLINRALFVTALVVLFIPAHITIIPLYVMSVKAGLYDSYAALILPWLVQPIGIFLVKQYIEGIPTAMEEAARIDGASEFRTLFTVVMPVCKPVLVVLAIQIFFTNWNSFLFPFILTSRESLRTLPVALAMFQGHQAIDWQHLMAGASLAVLPILVIFVLLQRHIVSGITAGAIKQ